MAEEATSTSATTSMSIGPGRLVGAGRVLLGNPVATVPVLGLAALLEGGLLVFAPSALFGVTQGDPVLRTTLSQAVLFEGVLLGVYTLLIAFLRAVVGPRGGWAWLPGLLTIPALLVGVGISPGLDTVFDVSTGPTLALGGLGLFWTLFGVGGSILWFVHLAVAERRDRPAGLGALLARWVRDLPRVLAPYGGAVLARFAGFQVIWPGLVYTVDLVFVVQVAVVHPGLRPHRRSRHLARASWPGIVALLGVALLAVAVLELVGMAVGEGLHIALGDPTFPGGGLPLGRLAFAWTYAQLLGAVVRLPIAGVFLGALAAHAVIAAVTVALTQIYLDLTDVEAGQAE